MAPNPFALSLSKGLAPNTSRPKSATALAIQPVWFQSPQPKPRSPQVRQYIASNPFALTVS